MKIYTYICIMTLINNMPILCMDTELLLPVYHAKNQFTTTTKNLQSDQSNQITSNYLPNKIYKAIMSSENHQIIDLLNDMQLIQKSTSLDAIGQHVYNNYSWLDIYDKNKTILTLFCLKQYFIDLTKTQEKIPSKSDDLLCYTKLAQILDLKIENNDPYPAYSNLKKNIFQIKKSNDESLNPIVHYLYNNTDKSNKDSSYMTKNFNDFYKQAYEIYTDFNGVRKRELYEYPRNQIENIFTLVSIVNHSLKKLNQNPNENFVRLATFDPNTLENQFSYFSDFFFFEISTKDYITLIYLLIKKYNKTREKKLTPSYDQYCTYVAIKKFNLALPNCFNTSRIDDTTYAFQEFSALIHNIEDLGEENYETIKNLLELYKIQNKDSLTS